MPEKSECFLFRGEPEGYGPATAFFETASLHHAEILAEAVGDVFKVKIGWSSATRFSLAEQVRIRSAISDLYAFTDPDPGIYDLDRSSSDRQYHQLAQLAALAEDFETHLPPVESASPDSEVNKPRIVVLTEDEHHALAVQQLMLFAQAYYKILECATDVNMNGANVTLNAHYVAVVQEIESILSNSRSMRGESIEFTPYADDIFPSTLEGSDWQYMVAPNAECLLSQVSRLFGKTNFSCITPGSAVEQLVAKTRADVESAVACALQHKKEMDEAFEALCKQNGTTSESVETEISRIRATDCNEAPRLRIGDEDTPWYINDKRVDTPSPEQEKLLKALLKAGDQGLGEGHLARIKPYPRGYLLGLKKKEGWSKIILFREDRKRLKLGQSGYQAFCMVENPEAI